MNYPITRKENSFGELYYTCDGCSQMASDISKIEHNCNRFVTDYNLPEKTEYTIRSIMDHCASGLQFGEASYLSDLDFDLDGVRWVRSGSTARVVLGLGRTNKDGEFHLPDRRGVVLKIDPGHRWADITGRGGNHDELRTWYQAVETGTSDLFGEIIAHAKDGAWVLMEEMIPVYPTHRKEMSDHDGVWDQDKEIIGELLREAEEHGWENPDWKHGNIGLTDDDQTKFIDYGTGPDWVSGAINC